MILNLWIMFAAACDEHMKPAVPEVKPAEDLIPFAHFYAVNNN